MTSANAECRSQPFCALDDSDRLQNRGMDLTAGYD